ncbi:MAG: hypothetical protein ACEY3J_03725 [Arsenophonus sp.]
MIPKYDIRSYLVLGFYDRIYSLNYIFSDQKVNHWKLVPINAEKS